MLSPIVSKLLKYNPSSWCPGHFSLIWGTTPPTHTHTPLPPTLETVFRPLYQPRPHPQDCDLIGVGEKDPCIKYLRWLYCVELFLVAQLCPTLCDPMDCSPPGSSVHGILQGILEWIAMLSFRGSFCPRDWTWVSYISFIGRQVLRTTSKQKNKQTNKQNQFKWLFGWMRPQVSSQLA